MIGWFKLHGWIQRYFTYLAYSGWLCDVVLWWFLQETQAALNSVSTDGWPTDHAWPQCSSVISTFSWGEGQFFFIFFNSTGQLKIWKKQHFICSNLTLFIVPFFLSFFFSLFFSFFSLFSFFSFFFLFFFFLGGGGGGRRPPSPPQMTPLPQWGFL